ncbi:MAG: AAA family ATPase [Symploca sp. SIO2D2]|nr:AAA family ATPase [Symploca sp. SIO2D2]
MLKRIYIDNFRCLVNFEMKFEDHISLFLGANGSGKTTVFEVLRKLRKFIIGDGDAKVLQVFPKTDLTRWETRLIQKFELDLEGNGGVYKYSLEIEHQEDDKPPKVRREKLTFDHHPLSDFVIEEQEDKLVEQATIYKDALPDNGSVLPFVDSSRSVVSAIPEKRDYQKLTWFKKHIARFIIVQINPFVMSAESRKEDPYPVWDMSNYAAWFSYLSGNQGKIFNLTLKLQEIIKGFDFFKNERSGTAKILSLSFPHLGKEPYKLTEISDGQKALIALYTLIYCAPDEDYTLCIDEPENFLALPEIQPWLNALFDQYSEERSHGQAIIISHHPALINYLASSSGHWFERTDEGLIRLQRITYEQDGGLSLAKLIELGWIYDE